MALVNQNPVGNASETHPARHCHFSGGVFLLKMRAPTPPLSFKREGYHKSDFDWRDFAEVMRYRGFWRMAAKNWREGLKELHRSFSKAAFVRSLQRLIPEIQSDDLIPSHAGVRAQALKLDGGMVDDFLIVRGPNSIHVCNAPSPAATASIPIGRAVAEQVTASAGRS